MNLPNQNILSLATEIFLPPAAGVEERRKRRVYVFGKILIIGVILVFTVLDWRMDQFDQSLVDMLAIGFLGTTLALSRFSIDGRVYYHASFPYY